MSEHSSKGVKKRCYIHGLSRGLKESETLDYDPSAYKLFKGFETQNPCLSFDLLSNNDDEATNSYPYSIYLVSGSQAERPKDNQLLTIHLSNLSLIKAKEGEENEDDDDSDDDEETNDNCKFHATIIPHFGGVNRIRSSKIGPHHVSAVWNDSRGVQLWNMSNSLSVLERMDGVLSTEKMISEKPLFTFTGHLTEGFAICWSPLSPGVLASGDISQKIFLWRMTEGGQWVVDQRALMEHTGSVEDLQWSHSEESLLLSCSSDKSLRLWDVRLSPKEACVCHVPDAHESDVNVVSWNKNEPLIVSGGDDGVTNIWSLKTIQYKKPVAIFKHHKAPITSVEWNPNDSTTFAASGEDDQVTFWDLSLEKDDDAMEAETNDDHTSPDDDNLPPQLLFVHMGQKEIKEVHWHPKIPGLILTTSFTGFDVFKTMNM